MIIPLPKYIETETVTANEGEIDYAYVRWYINCPNWTCHKCAAVMFGRCKYCVYCKVRLGQDTPRPTSYLENEYGT